MILHYIIFISYLYYIILYLYYIILYLYYIIFIFILYYIIFILYLFYIILYYIILYIYIYHMYMIYVTCLYIYPLSSGKPKSNSGPSHRWYIISLRVTVQISTWVQVKTSEYKEIHRDITIEHCHHTIFWSCSTSMLSKRIWPKSHRWKKKRGVWFRIYQSYIPQIPPFKIIGHLQKSLNP